jgi:hypothetical protein
MKVKEAVELFRSHQKSHVREKTRQSYEYLIRNFEALFAELTIEAISIEDVHLMR